MLCSSISTGTMLEKQTHKHLTAIQYIIKITISTIQNYKILCLSRSGYSVYENFPEEALCEIV